MAKDKDIRPKEGPRQDAEPYSGDDTRKVSRSEVPGGTVAEIEEWVSDDKARAEAAIAVEKSKGDSARTSLIAGLERIVNEDTGAGVESGEA